MRWRQHLKSVIFRTLQTSVTLTLDREIIGSYSIPSCITHRPLPTREILFQIRKTFVDGMDGQTHRQMYGQTLRPALLGRLAGVT